MKSNNIKTITIYSDSNLIHKFLSQTCQDFLLKTAPYSHFTHTTTNIWPSISVIDVRNQILFDKTIKPCLRSHAFCPLLLLIPNDLIILETFSSNLITVLTKPIKYQALIKTINHYKTNCIYQLSCDTFLNTKTLNLIKILNNENIEIKLTQLEFKILKYFLEIQNNDEKNYATEKEILNHVFRYNDLSSTNTFKVHMHRLKQKLGSNVIQRKNNGAYALATSYRKKK